MDNPTNVQHLLAIAQTRDLTKAERTQAREEITRYYGKKLVALQQKLFEAIEQHHTKELDPFTVDAYIHRYRKQSQELYAYINAHTHSNARLAAWLAAIDADEQGIQVWEPTTQLLDERQ